MTTEQEKDAWAKGSAVELAETAYCSQSPDLSGDMADWDLDYKLSVLSFLENLAVAVKEARRQLSESIAADLGEARGIMWRSVWFHVAPDRKPSVHDPQALTAYLGDDWPQVVPPTKANIGALKKLVVARGDSPNAWQSFMEYVEGEIPKLQQVSAEFAPLYAQRAKEGELVHRPTRKPKGIAS